MFNIIKSIVQSSVIRKTLLIRIAVGKTSFVSSKFNNGSHIPIVTIEDGIFKTVLHTFFLNDTIMSGRSEVLLSLSPLRTVLVGFPTHGSSILFSVSYGYYQLVNFQCMFSSFGCHIISVSPNFLLCRWSYVFPCRIFLMMQDMTARMH